MAKINNENFSVNETNGDFPEVITSNTENSTEVELENTGKNVNDDVNETSEISKTSFEEKTSVLEETIEEPVEEPIEETLEEKRLKALPSRLSPSRTKNFKQCPKLFYYTTLLKLRSPNTEATYKGTIAHYAFEHIFDNPRPERTPEKALEYVDAAWDALENPFKDLNSFEPGSADYVIRKDMKAYTGAHEENSEGYKALQEASEEFDRIIENKTKLLKETKDVVRSWFLMENPQVFDATERELHVEGSLDGVNMHGFIDRFDKITLKDGTVRYYVSDYKTGKPPKPQYQEEAFFQLYVYAAIIKEQLGIDVYELRLIYVREGDKRAILKRVVTPKDIKQLRQDVKKTWDEIQAAAVKDVWPTKKQVLCGWCYFKPVCPAWHPKLDGLLPEEIEKRLKP